MKLAVGVIVYKEASVKYLADFLPSLRQALSFLPADDYRVYVFDNSPSEYSKNREMLAGQSLEYLGVGKNLGFGQAYNVLLRAARTAGAPYFLIINPDTLLASDTIRKLLAALEKEPALASVSPKILRWDFASRQKTKIIDSAGLILKRGLRFQDLGQGLEDRGQFDSASILGPSGAAGLFRFSALDKIAEHPRGTAGPHYFDESFFMYKEDCDLAYRLFLAGYKSCLVPDALVYHDRTAAVSGHGFWRTIFSRYRKSRQIRAWSHLNQHFIYVKYWKKQNFISKVFIVVRVVLIFIFSLILEQFLLKQYREIWRYYRGLTNIK
ncbi:TPA: hypothetical protein DCZ15_01145 [Candidatus Falkowbacteria bacterium]|nr:MAG: Glycosyl transferase family protein [Candidatus Falkowbacteria bacterium GW2011_GWF2_43_32]HBA36462.1 hypothetical protein [Candidatus Falkowbacteria bacterium]